MGASSADAATSHAETRRWTHNRQNCLKRSSQPRSGDTKGIPTPFASSGSHKFYCEIAWLRGSGITTGYADATFRPENPISREATAAFLYRTIKGPGSAVKPARAFCRCARRQPVRWRDRVDEAGRAVDGQR
ncbi:S-layer homology domain-containing protein [Leifsonia xyli]|uniref:S-layer homology domain-containing protein n=1 Tax=Leifsonia xyli TaxID=1575 RepID=UPI0009D6BB93